MLNIKQILSLSLIKVAEKNKQNFISAIHDINALDEAALDFQHLFLLVEKYVIKNCTISELQAIVDRAANIVAYVDKHKINVVSILDQRYPRNLNGIGNQPIVLYVKGDAGLLNKDISVSIIGTRDPTKLARDYAYEFAKNMAHQGASVVSGLAIGCDTSAHEGALAADGGITIAVLAHGLDAVHPASNRSLAEKIIDNGGCLVSEYPPETTIEKWQLLARNRIITALTQATVVVQADRIARSGTMAAARVCIAQKKTLMCIDPYTLDPDNIAKYKGSLQILKLNDQITKINGATAEHILNNLLAAPSNTQQPITNYFTILSNNKSKKRVLPHSQSKEKNKKHKIN